MKIKPPPEDCFRPVAAAKVITEKRRLLALNYARYEAEVKAGLQDKKKKRERWKEGENRSQ
jgi:hypothetical protein